MAPRFLNSGILAAGVSKFQETRIIMDKVKVNHGIPCGSMVFPVEGLAFHRAVIFSMEWITQLLTWSTLRLWPT